MNITIWLTDHELLARWNHKPFELIERIRNGLTVYSKAFLKPYQIDPSLKIPSNLQGKVRIVPRGINSFIDLVDDSYGSRENFEFDPYQHLIIPDWGVLLPWLGECLFKKQEVEEFEREHPELREVEALEKEQSLFCQKTASGLDAGPEQENKAFVQMLKDYDHDILIVWKAMVKDARLRKVELAISEVSELQNAAKDIMEYSDYNFNRLKAKDLNDENLFVDTKDSASRKRYFRETLHQRMIRKDTHRKDITKSEIRTLLKKIH